MKYVLALCISLLLCRCGNPLSTGTPIVVYKTPAAGETDVAINRKVTVTFSEAMDAPSFTLETFYLVDVPGTVTCSGNSATFVPERNLTPNSVYTAFITARIKSRAGTPLADLQQWSFTTGAMADSIAPSINSIFPASASTGVALDRKISVTFSEVIDSISITLSDFSLHQGSAAVPGTIRIVGPIATFVPDQNLAQNETYTATLTTEVKDLAGNAMAEDHSWSFTTGDAIAGQSPVSLGSAFRFAVLAKSVSSVGLSTVSGDLGSYPDAGISGFPPAIVTGSVFPGNSVAAAAFIDMGNAGTDLTVRQGSSGNLSEGDLGGMVIVPGIYRFSSSLKIDSAEVTLSAQGDPNAIFIFQTPLSLVVSSGRKVILSQGARSGNIFWRVESAELGTNSVIDGTILADQSITLHSGAILNGRAFSQSGTVSLDTCTVRFPAP
jgi:hypothetical protein